MPASSKPPGASVTLWMAGSQITHLSSYSSPLDLETEIACRWTLDRFFTHDIAFCGTSEIDYWEWDREEKQGELDPNVSTPSMCRKRQRSPAQIKHTEDLTRLRRNRSHSDSDRCDALADAKMNNRETN